MTIAADAVNLLKYNNMCACSGSCNCEEIITLPTGADGAAGADGAYGLFGGFSLGWKFSTSTSSSPASTTIRLNSATYSAVSTIYINDTNTDSVNSQAFLDAFTNSSNYGLIKIFKADDSTKFWMGTITSNTDSGTYHTVGVTYITSNGAFALDDELVVSFIPKGATGSAGSSGSNGSNGTNGTDGTTLLFNNNTSDSFTTTGSFQTFTNKTYTAAADTLPANGDLLKIRAVFTKATTSATPTPQLGLFIGGTDTLNFASQLIMGLNCTSTIVDVEISRVSNTLSRQIVTVFTTDTAGDPQVRYLNTQQNIYDFTGSTLTIEAKAKTYVNAGTVYCDQLKVELVKQ